MTKRERFFVNIVGNLIIAAVIVTVLAVSFSGEISMVFSSDVVKPHYSGDVDSNKVTVMINVYWGEEYLIDMLETLKSHKAVATFFIGGMWAEKNGELLTRIVKDGHELANHGYFHRSQDKLSYDKNYEEIRACEGVIESITGVKTRFFMPPSGAYGRETLQAAEALGYTTVMWSKDTIDWRDKDRSLILKRATNNVKGGDLVLMHPTQATSEALGDILKFYIENGFSIVPISNNIKA